ncbi:hypothetical protein JR316_0000347 [Psilocybe cubensis]|uniref:Uncharacterized protein n=2 Tax=Psilocybe cubensis TaxID=181762 RepID=A0ACB8HER1_PSICU|nr:hypothetical protein JR316_0000347 [Psilocybe cubensis]KAH9486283.1 hypothetical protein JR316_0000347 [Psilocybe cubensis]
MEQLPQFHEPEQWKSANALFVKYRQGGDLTSRERAVSLFRKLLQSFPKDHPELFPTICNLGNAFLAEFTLGISNINDIDECILLYRTALACLPQPASFERPNRLRILADALVTRYQEGKDRVDLDESIALYKEAIELQSLSHPDRPNALLALGYALMARYHHRKHLKDLEDSAAIYKLFPPSGHPLEFPPEFSGDRSTIFDELAYGRAIRLVRGGNKRDLDEILSIMERFEEPPAAHRDVSRFWLESSIAAMIHSEVNQTPANKRLERLEESVAWYKRALKNPVLPHETERRWNVLFGLGTALRIQYFCLGRKAQHLDEAITVIKQALQLEPLVTELRSVTFITLCDYLAIRFQATRSIGDLDESISACKDWLRLGPPTESHASRGFLRLSLLLQWRQMLTLWPGHNNGDEERYLEHLAQKMTKLNIDMEL